jgi:hypothetical protein
LVLAVFSWRPFRTSCWIVGTESPSSLYLPDAPERVSLLIRAVKRGWPAVLPSIPTPEVGRVADPRTGEALPSLGLIGEKNSGGQGYPAPARYGPKGRGFKTGLPTDSRTHPPCDGHEDTGYPGQAPMVKTKPSTQSLVPWLVYTTLRVLESFPRCGGGLHRFELGLNPVRAVLVTTGRAPGLCPGPFLVALAYRL